jgi:uncharacterized protein YqjF (DUF2071 family)
LLANRGEPFLVADWIDVLMCHLEVDPAALQRATPFPIDVRAGRAYVSLVFFLLRRMRPRRGGPWTEWLFRPLATHPFLNVRTYVEQDGEPGIYFLAEWLPNRLSVALGPRVFGLPYRLGHFTRQNQPAAGTLAGAVSDHCTGAQVRYEGSIDLTDAHDAMGLNDSLDGARDGSVRPSIYQPCVAGSLEEWLMERYTAFTCQGSRRGFFRVWHPPWPQVEAEVRLTDDTLLRRVWPWMSEARWVGANYSPGLESVWMGRPHT